MPLPEDVPVRMRDFMYVHMSSRIWLSYLIHAREGFVALVMLPADMTECKSSMSSLQWARHAQLSLVAVTDVQVNGFIHLPA